MFSPAEIKKRFYPGQEWCYFKIYMGPETAEEWLCFNLPVIIKELNVVMPGFQYFFVRYLDPDFHIRLRIKLPHHGDFAKAVDLLNLHSSLLLKQGLIWKLEIATYERETERYGITQIKLFESAFNADSQFWISVLPWLSLQDDREELRWRIALLSTVRYYEDLISDKNLTIEISDKIVNKLRKEQKIGRNMQFQIDQKLRALRPELLSLLEKGLHDHPRLITMLDQRSKLINEIFGISTSEGGFFSGQPGTQSITGLAHMSINRGLRARHRQQEYVIYYFISKLLRTQQALV